MSKLAIAHGRDRNAQNIRRQLTKLGENRDRQCLFCGQSFTGVCHLCSQRCTMAYWQTSWELDALDYLNGIANTDRVSNLVGKFNKEAKIKGWRKRSHNAIIVMLTRSANTAEAINDNWTASELARQLNIIRHRVYKWIKNGKLISTTPKGRPEKGGKSSLHQISARSFRLFCRQSPHLLQGIEKDKIAVLYGADRQDLDRVLSAISTSKNERGLAIKVMQVSTLDVFRSVKFAAKKTGLTDAHIRWCLDRPDKDWVTVGRGSKNFRVEYWEG
jgi:hypothetical protein